MPLAVTLYQGENCAKSPNAIYPLVSPQHTFAFTMPSNQIGPQFEPPPGQYICLNRTIKTANGRIFARAGVSYITQEPLDEVPVMPKDYFNVPWEELLGWRAEPWHTVFIVDKQISVEVWFTVDEFDPLPAATFNLFASREFQIRMHFQDCTRITIELHHTFYPTSKCPETIHFNYFRDEIPLDYGVFRRFLDPASPTNDAPTQFIVTWDYITDEIRFCLAKFRYMEPRCFTTPMQHLSDYCLPSWEVYEDRSFSSVYPQPSVSVYYAAVYNGTLSAQDVRVLYEHTPFATYADALYKDPSVLAEDENNPALLYLTGKE